MIHPIEKERRKKERRSRIGKALTLGLFGVTLGAITYLDGCQTQRMETGPYSVDDGTAYFETEYATGQIVRLADETAIARIQYGDSTVHIIDRDADVQLERPSTPSSIDEVILSYGDTSYVVEATGEHRRLFDAVKDSANTQYQWRGEQTYYDFD